MKWLNKIWPWSVINELRTDLSKTNHKLAFQVSIHDDFKKWAGEFCLAVYGECTKDQLVSIQARVDHVAEAECAVIGNAAHMGKTPLGPTPKQSKLMDPKLEGSPLGNGVRFIMGDASLPKMDDVKTDWELGGAVFPGDPFRIRTE